MRHMGIHWFRLVCIESKHSHAYHLIRTEWDLVLHRLSISMSLLTLDSITRCVVLRKKTRDTTIPFLTVYMARQTLHYTQNFPSFSSRHLSTWTPLSYKNKLHHVINSTTLFSSRLVIFFTLLSHMNLFLLHAHAQREKSLFFVSFIIDSLEILRFPIICLTSDFRCGILILRFNSFLTPNRN